MPEGVRERPSGVRQPVLDRCCDDANGDNGYQSEVWRGPLRRKGGVPLCPTRLFVERAQTFKASST
eukprot:3919046-Pyramimonas_sp.AAC.2